MPTYSTPHAIARRLPLRRRRVSDPTATLEPDWGGRGRFHCSGRLGRWVMAWQLCLLVLVCSCKAPIEPARLDMTAQKIVFRHAEAAFETALDPAVPAERDALMSFQSSIVGARNRTELARAWNAIPVLKAHGSDFLEVQVFARAARDTDWPSGAGTVDERTVYVEGVTRAVAEVLAAAEEDHR